MSECAQRRGRKDVYHTVNVHFLSLGTGLGMEEGMGVPLEGSVSFGLLK